MHIYIVVLYSTLFFFYFCQMILVVNKRKISLIVKKREEILGLSPIGEEWTGQLTFPYEEYNLSSQKLRVKELKPHQPIFLPKKKKKILKI